MTQADRDRLVALKKAVRATDGDLILARQSEGRVQRAIWEIRALRMSESSENQHSS